MGTAKSERRRSNADLLYLLVIADPINTYVSANPTNLIFFIADPVLFLQFWRKKKILSSTDPGFKENSGQNLITMYINSKKCCNIIIGFNSAFFFLLFPKPMNSYYKQRLFRNIGEIKPDQSIFVLKSK